VFCLLNKNVADHTPINLFLEALFRYKKWPLYDKNPKKPGFFTVFTTSLLYIPTKFLICIFTKHLLYFFTLIHQTTKSDSWV